MTDQNSMPEDHRTFPMKFEPHHPSWLIALARQQRPDLPWLADSLTLCTTAAWRSREHRYLVFQQTDEGSARPRYQETISLEDATCGQINVDVAIDNRIMGVEFYDRLLSKNSSSRHRANNLRRQNQQKTSDKPPKRD
jgi:hypothetical protein